jgi:hypothetical protein
LLVLSLVLNGCIVPLPVDDEIPYKDDFTYLKVGSSKKSDVVSQFGEPAAIYSHGSTYVYSDFEQTWEAPYILVAPGCCGAEAGVATFGNRHYLILDFDQQGILQDRRIEVGDGRVQCTDTGICYSAAGHIVWFAGDEEETRVKEFQTPGNGCGIYLYLDGTVFPRQTSVKLDGESLGQVGSIGAGFFYLEVAKGDHLIVAHQAEATPDSDELPVGCRDEELVFVRLKIRHNSTSTPLLERVDHSTGRRKIRGRRLINPQSSR